MNSVEEKEDVRGGVSRRGFLRELGAGGGAIGSGVLVTRAHAEPAGKESRLHLGATTYNVLMDWDLDKIIRDLPDLGFEAVELRTTHRHGVEPSIGQEERKAVRRKFEASRLRLLSFGTTCEFQSVDPAVRKKNVETAKEFVILARDTGATAIRVRPNGLPKEVSTESTIRNIAACLGELGDFGAGYGVEIWMEVHGPQTQNPPISAAIMRATRHQNVGVCWNSNPTDVVNGSVKPSFDLLGPFIKNAHITELADEKYPWRELFTLLRQAKYDRYTLCEAQASKEPERFLHCYKALWTELCRPCS
ncbi:MAG: sugar phosphate isomerase/epimerase [Acidobacteria bacterium]|nr:sugar phosphate isomerase/epimerase [Acidobacteriota bacterium]